MMGSTFKSISLSYQKAPVEIRELIALDQTAIEEILSEAKDTFDLNELLILSTCNRTELYYSSPEDLSSALISFIGIKKGIAHPNAYQKYFEFFNQEEAIDHLFRVSIGLEAQVLGDMQIANQVKQSYQLTANADLAGPFLHRLLHAIFFTSKRVAQETAFRDGAASVSYAAYELTKTLATSIIEPKILVVGLGDIGSDLCRHLSATDLNVKVCNRTLSKARELATECNFDVVPFEQFEEELFEADIIISSVAKSEPLITKDSLGDTEIRGYKYFVDLAMPRSIDKEVEKIPGAVVYNIDDIHSKTNSALIKRQESIPQVEQIIREASVEFNDWSKEMIVSPTIAKLKSALDEIRKSEITKHLKNATESEKVLADKLTKGITQKIMNLPVIQLKAACKRGDAENLIEVLNDLFNLEGQHQQK